MEEQNPTPLNEQPAFPTKTLAVIVVVFMIAGLAFFIWHSYLLNTDPLKECTYRGGTWSEEHGCVFEGGVGKGNQQVGMTVTALSLTIPDVDEHIEVSFPDVEVGSKGAYSAEFSQPGTGASGSVTLLSDLARVHKDTQDLLMPFAVNLGGSGMFMYLGIFEKTEAGYVHRDSHFAGDRVGPESLVLSALASEDSYTARFLFRDRKEGEPSSAIPTEPIMLDATIVKHAFDRVFMESRDGLLHNDLLKVGSPDLYEKISSPVSVKGEARGTWFFEASFPITLVDWDGKILAEGHAQADGDWMTEEFVPFTGMLTFTVPDDIPYRRGTLIFKKDNPSGLPENEDSFEIPVTF